MHALRHKEYIRSNLSRYFQYLISDLIGELYQCYQDVEHLNFPGDEILDILNIHEGDDRRLVIRCLKTYASEIQCLWVEYSLTDIMSINLYLNCSVIPTGDLLLCQIPTSSRGSNNGISI
jgi:hypothetical protein